MSESWAGRHVVVTGGAGAYTALNFTVWDRTHSPGMQALSLLHEEAMKSFAKGSKAAADFVDAYSKRMNKK